MASTLVSTLASTPAFAPAFALDFALTSVLVWALAFALGRTPASALLQLMLLLSGALAEAAVMDKRSIMLQPSTMN
ncbi:hypothetical protein INT47_006582 [Mucor saturninus]|uniref:Uncharacterized protein n=1 Tax=Mucor saturninus TaxID=64648 RepID=A0A8H7V2K5_9FUNG|nr:hypothetical protein INT47_006582 [Mucor saturninus]